MERDELVALLKDLGFTEYEAKVYLELLKGSPATAYSAARGSGVPRSKVYGVLEGMVGRGVVFVSHGDPACYAPLPPGELVRARRREADAVLSAAEEGLEGWAAREDGAEDDRIWDIKGRREILSRLKGLVDQAEERVLLQVWREDAPELEEELKEAAGRGVEVTVVAYGDPGYPFARVYLHDPGPEVITPEYGGRWIILSVDAREVVAGAVFPEDIARAAWSAHPGIVMPITEQVKHDLYVAEMLCSHREVLEEEYGPSLELLRAKFGPPATAYRRPRAPSDRADGQA